MFLYACKWNIRIHRFAGAFPLDCAVCRIAKNTYKQCDTMWKGSVMAYTTHTGELPFITIKADYTSTKQQG